jgi:hypothetical protein
VRDGAEASRPGGIQDFKKTSHHFEKTFWLVDSMTNDRS